VYDTALLYRDAFGAVRDGGQIVVVRGWDGNEVEERGIRVHPVMVFRVLERTDWLEELRELASIGRLKLRVARELPPEQAAEAHRLMDAGGLRGRAVIVF
jgi:NADPH:quinone reductase-like Zn-dependent oxidoreductase